MKSSYENLLKTWVDRLLQFQIHDMGDTRLDGGFLCPACMTIHGRCTDLVYPLLYLADHYGNEPYLDAALKLFDWGENLLCDDGSYYNDAQSAWNGITVFSAVSLCEALKHHGHLLSAEERERFEGRLHRMADWVYENLTMEFQTNINYHATTAGAMALLGAYWNRTDYLERAREMANSCFGHITGDGLLYGEGKPMEYVTKRRCRPVDIGYNVEESIPGLLLYAQTMGDEKALAQVKQLLFGHLEFMLPDGGWDNSFGTRNFKWTYWGSRTSDGSQEGYGLWGDEEPVFAEAAYRNLELYRTCTHDGLLHGGPDYVHHGERACIHHTFSHAKSLTTMLNHGVPDWKRCSLPSEKRIGFYHYPTVDTWRIYEGPWIGTVTAYDFEYLKGGHASGGTLTMLYHKEAGPIIAGSMTVYSLFEAHNMQQSLKKSEHRTLVPRLEYRTADKTTGVYATCFDTEAVMEANEANGTLTVLASPVSADHSNPGERITCRIGYRFTEDEVIISGQVPKIYAASMEYVLPVIGEKAVVEGGSCAGNIFFLPGGFEAKEYHSYPNEEGKFEIKIRI